MFQTLSAGKTGQLPMEGEAATACAAPEIVRITRLRNEAGRLKVMILFQLIGVSKNCYSHRFFFTAAGGSRPASAGPKGK